MRFESDNNTVITTHRLRRFVERIQQRLAGEEGFTLVELTIVLLILGILLTIAVPSYLSFKDRAYKTAAKADVAQAMRSVIAYGADNYPNAPSDPDRGHDGQRLHGHHAADPRDEVRRVDLDRRRRAVRHQPGRLCLLVHRLLPDRNRRALDRRPARPRWRHHGRHALHSRHLHGQLTPRDSGERT